MISHALSWGDNRLDELGTGTAALAVSIPSPVIALGSEVLSIAAGGFHGVALLGDGTVLSWGANQFGQLGDGTTTSRATPVQVLGLGPGSGVAALAAGSTFTMALLIDGTVLAWGGNLDGQLGDGSAAPQQTHPVQAGGLGPGSGVRAIAAGYEQSLALLWDGTVLAWGETLAGTGASQPTPLVVPGLGPGSGVVAIGLKNQTDFAIGVDGSVLGWGRNDAGQVGDGTTNPRPLPTPVSGLGPGSGVVAVTEGGGHTLALLADGTVLSWGANGNGQLGDGTTADRHAPGPVQGLGSGSAIVAVDAGGAFSLALRWDGAVLAWGGNAEGELGDGTTTDRSTPAMTAVGPNSGVTQLAAGARFGFAVQQLGVPAWRLWMLESGLHEGSAGVITVGGQLVIVVGPHRVPPDPGPLERGGRHD